MKKLRLIFLLSPVILFMTLFPVHASEGQLINDILLSKRYTVPQNLEISQSADSLGIFHLPGGPYYIYCSVCPIETRDGFMLMKILDTLNFIDPDIPQREWLNAYVSGNYSYNWIPKKSVITFKNQEFRVDNRWNDTRALLVGDSIKSFTLTNVTRNDEINSVNFGKFMIIGLFIFGLVIGLFIKNLNKHQIITFIGSVSIAAFFIYIMFNGTLLALSIPIGSFLLGILTIFAALNVLHSLNKKK